MMKLLKGLHRNKQCSLCNNITKTTSLCYMYTACLSDKFKESLTPYKKTGVFDRYFFGETHKYVFCDRCLDVVIDEVFLCFTVT